MNMKRRGVTLSVIVALVLAASCAFAVDFDSYDDQMFIGKQFLDRGEYGRARTCFVRATRLRADGMSLAFAATATYKIKHFIAAEHFIKLADGLQNKGFADLRVAGYKVLVLYARGRKDQAMEALKEYAEIYSHLSPLQNIEVIREMIWQGKIDPVLLEALVDEQATRYEDESGQWMGSFTGYGDRAP